MSSVPPHVPTDADEFAPLPPECWPDVEHLVTEDDTPVDIFSSKQQRLLVEPLYSSWFEPGEKQPFLALSNVGLFYAVHQPPLVPDMMLSLDVSAPADLMRKAHRSYFLWMYGKPPDVVIEIVSDRTGGEDSEKLVLYARIGVPYYVIFDPEQLLSAEVLRVYGLHPGRYLLQAEQWFPHVQVGLTLWSGRYEQMQAPWLRWCRQDGSLILTGTERAEEARQARERSRLFQRDEDHAEQRAEHAEQRAERLAARLRELGIDPDS